MTKLTRRGYIKLAATGLAAQPALAQRQVKKDTWKLGETGGENPEEVSVVPTVCPYCGVSCSIDLYTDGSRLGWPRDSPESPINAGFLCSRESIRRRSDETGFTRSSRGGEFKGAATQRGGGSLSLRRHARCKCEK